MSDLAYIVSLYVVWVGVARAQLSAYSATKHAGPAQRLRSSTRLDASRRHVDAVEARRTVGCGLRAMSRL